MKMLIFFSKKHVEHKSQKAKSVESTGNESL